MHHPAEEDWSEVFDQQFTAMELKEAVDFADIVTNYRVTDALLKSFIRDDLKVGHRLFLIMNLSPNELGVMAMRDPDDRLAHVIKMRCGEINRQQDGRNLILLPGEE